MSELAHCFEIVLKAVVVTHQRERDELRLGVNHFLHAANIDAPVARLHYPQVQAQGFE